MRILLTAFEPYDHWEQNSSWEALSEWLRVNGVPAGVTTRRYPVDLNKMQERLAKDLLLGFDAILHLGQAPGIHSVHIEAIAINVAGMTQSEGDYFGPLIPDGPVAFRSAFPLNHWDNRLRSIGIPSSISYHAGTYLCNALMYLSHHWHMERKLSCPVGFLHFPLIDEQVLKDRRNLPSMKRDQLASVISTIINQIQNEFGEHELNSLA